MKQDKVVLRPLLEIMKVRYENPPPVNTLQQVALNIITSKNEYLVEKQEELREKKAAKKRADEAALNAKARKIREN